MQLKRPVYRNSYAAEGPGLTFSLAHIAWIIFGITFFMVARTHFDTAGWVGIRDWSALIAGIALALGV